MKSLEAKVVVTAERKLVIRKPDAARPGSYKVREQHVAASIDEAAARKLVPDGWEFVHVPPVLVLRIDAEGDRPSVTSHVQRIPGEHFARKQIDRLRRTGYRVRCTWHDLPEQISEPRERAPGA